jgi:hypothetical protein
MGGGERHSLERLGSEEQVELSQRESKHRVGAEPSADMEAVWMGGGG